MIVHGGWFLGTTYDTVVSNLMEDFTQIRSYRVDAAPISAASGRVCVQAEHRGPLSPGPLVYTSYFTRHNTRYSNTPRSFWLYIATLYSQNMHVITFQIQYLHQQFI